MLNIGLMDAEQGGYYLAAVARGREDYYLHAGEAPGVWHGGGAEHVAVVGRVADTDFTALLHHRDPSTLPAGEQDWRRADPMKGRRSKIAAIDKTYRAPKSVSLLAALATSYGHREVADLVRDAHDRAVEAGEAYMASVAGHGRRGKGGADRVEGTGFITALFRHRTSRAGDPQLHTHAVSINRVLGKDGRWGSIDSKSVFAHAKTAGTIYQAVLRHEMRSLGLEWELGRDDSGRLNGTAEIRGIDRRVRRAFSKRRVEIEEAMRVRGDTSPRAAQVATLATRHAKEYGVDGALLEFRWADEACRVGFTPELLDRLLDVGRRHAAERAAAGGDVERAQAAEAGREALGPVGLTERATSFRERDVIRAFAAGMEDGAPLDRLLHYSRQLIADPELVRCEERGLGRSEVIRPWTPGSRGQVVPAFAAGETRYTTRDLLGVETAALDLARPTPERDARAVVTPESLNDAMDGCKARGINLESGTGEQAMMVRQLTLSGDLVDVVNAPAGCGKTTGMEAAARAWEASGYRVVGAALGGRTAAILAEDAGIPTFTVAQILHELASDRFEGFAPRTVLIVDEAGQVGTRALARILGAVAAADDCKLTLIGDSHQMPEIEAGGLFRALIKELPVFTLAENRRQLDVAEQQRLRQLRDGSVTQAVESWDEAGRIVRADTAEDARNLLAVTWAASHLAAGPSPAERAQVAMLALTNGEVNDLNRRGRLLLADSGLLTGPELVAGDRVERGYRVGDLVVTRKISRVAGFRVNNGDRWTVTGVDVAARCLTIRSLNGQRSLVVPEGYLDSGNLHHGYALTVTLSQGSTLREVHALGSTGFYREAGYVAASRATGETRFYLAGPSAPDDEGCCDVEHAHGQRQVEAAGQPTLDLGELGVLVEVDPVERFAAALAKRGAQPLARDTESPAEPRWLPARDPLPAPPVRAEEHTGATLDLGV